MGQISMEIFGQTGSALSGNQQPAHVSPSVFGLVGFLVGADAKSVFLSIKQRQVAERVGFEPTVGLHLQRFSRPPRSTTPAPLRALGGRL